MSDPLPRIRPARPEEAGHLGDIAMRAKAHWGYGAEDLARWADELIVTPRQIATCPTWVASLTGKPVGFCLLVPAAADWSLDHLWVLPEAIGRGIGRALLDRARCAAHELGAQGLAIDSDPHAEAFYLASGARRVGEIAAPLDGQPGRVRPQLRLPTRCPAT